jgi:hypothetical protein
VRKQHLRYRPDAPAKSRQGLSGLQMIRT